MANKSEIEMLLSIKNGKKDGEVVYHYENGATQSCPINKEVFYNEKGNAVSPQQILKLFKDTVSDRRAKSFSIHI